MKNNIAKLFVILIAVAMFAGCGYGRYAVKTISTETTYPDGKVVKNTTQEEVPIAVPEVFYPATGNVYSFPVYNTGYGYGCGYGYGYDHKVKETQKDKSESSYWNYSGPNGFSAGGQKDSSKSTNKWHWK